MAPDELRFDTVRFQGMPRMRLQVEMYADPTARAGVLEPQGVVEIKFKKPDLLALMERLDPDIAALRQNGDAGRDAKIAKRQRVLLPVYHQVRHLHQLWSRVAQIKNSHDEDSQQTYMHSNLGNVAFDMPACLCSH